MICSVNRLHMDAASKIKIAATLAVCLLAAGCHTAPKRAVTTRAFMDRNTVTGTSRQRIWESTGVARGCDVTVTYRGTASSPARLMTNKTGDTGSGVSPEAQTTDWARAEDVTVKLRAVQEIWLANGGKGVAASGSESFYVIERVNSSRGARLLDSATLPGATLTSAVVNCGAVEQTIWKSPVPAGEKELGCHVTVRARSVGRSRPVLHFTQANGVRRDLMVGYHGELVTLLNVVNIGASCAGGDGRCSVEIMQTDCPQ